MHGNPAHLASLRLCVTTNTGLPIHPLRDCEISGSKPHAKGAKVEKKMTSRSLRETLFTQSETSAKFNPTEIMGCIIERETSGTRKTERDAPCLSRVLRVSRFTKKRTEDFAEVSVF